MIERELRVGNEEHIMHSGKIRRGRRTIEMVAAHAASSVW
jgi:hypothetical protein